MNPNKSALQIALLFLRLGTLGFGGPAAHIAMMENEVVTRKKWISREKFLDLLAVTNVIPGPNSTELAIHIGYMRGGWVGLVIAGTCFITPAVLIVMAVSWVYVEYSQLPEIYNVLNWIKPVIIAVICHAIWSLSKTALKSIELLLLGLTSLGLIILGLNEIQVMALSAIIYLAYKKTFKKNSIQMMCTITATGIGGIFNKQNLAWSAATTTAALIPFSMNSLFWFFFKVGSVLYGSGYVLLSFLQNELVEQRRWITEAQMLDAITVGQFTPGPVFTTATFIGYILNGPNSALLATLGIFLPAFIFVALSAPFISRLRSSKNASIALDALNVTSLALMIFVCFQLGLQNFTGYSTILVFLISLFLMVCYKVNSSWLILTAGIFGFLTK